MRISDWSSDVCSADLLIEVLVGHRDPHPVLPELREHAGHRERGELLELVDVQEEGAALFRRRIRPAEAGEPHRRHQEPAEQDRRSTRLNSSHYCAPPTTSPA